MQNSYSNYPDGFDNGLLLSQTSISSNNQSSVYWVGNNATLEVGERTASDNNKGTYLEPFSTIDYAIGQCKANNINTIKVRASYTQTITAASAITCDVAGLQIIGLGTPEKRPTLTFSTSTAASVLISAANVSIIGFIGVAGIDGLLNPFYVQAAGCTLDIEWQDGSSTVEAACAILTTAAADNLRINLKYIGFPAGDAAVKAIGLVGVNNARINIDAYGIWSTSIIQFLTTVCTNIAINGYFYNSGTTNFTKDVIDTVTGSTWFCSGYDGAAGSSFSGGSGAALAGDDISTVIANQAVPTADSTANTLSRDVVGNKTDTSVYVPGSTNSITAYAKGTSDLQEKVALSATAVMVNNNTIFTVAGGPIEIIALVSECVTSNDTTASTVQYSITPTSGSAQTISGASSSIASAAAGASITLAGTALATAALYNSNGPNLIANPGTIYCPAGTIKVVIGVGSTTGTWRHRIRYRPLATGVTVS